MPLSRLTLPSWRGKPDDAVRVMADVDSWGSSEALVELVRAFGGAGRDAADLAALDVFASSHWDFRAGRERDQAAATHLTDAQCALILEHADSLGLANRDVPGSQHYDVAILTGGMVRAAIVKPRAVNELRARGVVIDRVVFLGAHRPFSADEKVLAKALGVSGDDEVDGMIHGVRRGFSVGDGAAVDRSPEPAGPASWGRWAWGHAAAAVEVVAAASAAPAHRRANTADTFRFWADRFADDALSVLVITTPVYVPYQGAVAVETLGIERGFVVETVGVSVTASDLGELTQPFTARHHLQELRSAIHGMASLKRALQSHSGAY